jgi:folate-dependent phosphoribosylglycinamide formyltransferase PurN
MKKIKLFVFFSGGASGLKYLMENDPNFGILYEVVGGFTDNKNATGRKLFDDDMSYDFTDWCADNNCAKKDMVMREKYFDEVIELLEIRSIDVILLSGFMLKITPNFIEKYKNMIINVHPADLRVLEENGKPKYTGDYAVKKAMKAGETRTYSTVHFVTDEVDCGEIIAVSDGLPVVSSISADEQQNLMKTMCDGPAIAQALELIATEKVAIGTEEDEWQ